MRRFRVPVPEKATKKFKIIISNTTQEIEVNPDDIPFGRHGLPGSILDIVSSVDENLIEHTCGGVQACSTCHIYVTKGFDNCNETSEREEDYLEKARAVELNSRLACCCVPNGEENISIEIPQWNVNEVKENH